MQIPGAGGNAGSHLKRLEAVRLTHGPCDE